MIKKLKLLLGLDFGLCWESVLRDKGWLIFRVILSLLMLRHGYGKLMGFAEMAATFPDPLHLGSGISLSFTIFAEFFASITLLFGLFSRWSAFAGFFTMLVVALIVHGSDVFHEKELPLLYAACYLFFMITGAGKYSLDNYLSKKLK